MKYHVIEDIPIMAQSILKIQHQEGREGWIHTPSLNAMDQGNRLWLRQDVLYLHRN